MFLRGPKVKGCVPEGSWGGQGLSLRGHGEAKGCDPGQSRGGQSRAVFPQGRSRGNIPEGSSRSQGETFLLAFSYIVHKQSALCFFDEQAL